MIPLTLTDDALIGGVVLLLKMFIKPSRLEGQLVLLFIPLLLNIIKKSHREHTNIIRSLEKDFRILKDKIKGDKMTLG